jgi:hypothetical protein
MSDLISTDVPEMIVTTRVGEFTVTPVRMGQFKAFSAVAAPVVGDVTDYMDGAGDLVELIDKHESSLFTMTTICSGLTQDQYQQMMPDDYVELVGAVVEINTDFFVRNLLPKVAGRVQSIMSRVQNIKSQMTGMTQSTPSEVAVTV